MIRPKGHQSATARAPSSAQGGTTAGPRPADSPPYQSHDPDRVAVPQESLLSSTSPSGSGTSSGESPYEWPEPVVIGQAGGIDLGGMVFDLDFSVEDADAGTSADMIDSTLPPHLSVETDLAIGTDLTVDAVPAPGSTPLNPAAALLGLVPRSLSLVPEASGVSLELLSHYLGVTTNSMDNGSTHENPFIVQLVPLAFSSDLVLQLILTQSAVHRASRSLPDTTAVASQHYSHSLRLFQRSISSYNSEQSVELLTLTVGALIMCFVETAKGDINGTVFDHLMAARWLLLAFLAQKSTVPKSLRDFLIEYYVYTATLSMVSIDSRISPQCLLGDELEAHGRALVNDGYVGSLCGCWLELLLSIPTIFNIGRRFLAEANASQPATADDFALFAKTYNQIQNWAPDASIHQDVALAGRFFQQAMIVYLYTALNSISRSESSPHHAPVVQAAVSDALDYLSQIPPSARINTSFCWPIAVVGSCMVSEEQRDLLRARLDVMFKAIGLGNICQTAVLLERVWESPDTDPWNICHVMQEHQIWISFA